MSNYFQPAPNGGGSGAGRHGNAPPPPDQYRQARPPPGQMMRPYADMRNGNSHGHSGPAAGQNNGGHYGGGLPPNGGQAFSHSNLGPSSSSYGSMGNGGGGGGGGGQRMHPRNDNFGPMRGGDPRVMNGANNDFGANADFKYRSLSAPPYGSMAHPGSRGDLQQQQQRRSRWDDLGQQQQPRHQQQQQQDMQYQQHHQHRQQQQQQQQQHQNHQGYPGHSYNSNQPMPASSTYANVSYMPGNDNSNSGRYNGNIQQPSLPVAIPPPPPPPPASYLNTERKRELAASAIVEKKATSEEVPKDDKPPLPPPPVSRPPSKPPPDVIDLTDNAVNAMNALCSLEGRWGAGGKRNEQQEGDKSGKSKKRRARKKKKNKGSTNADGISANKEEPALLVLDNAGDGWIEVDDNSLAEKKRKLEPPGKKGPVLAPDSQDGHFPPLAPVKSGGETDDGGGARLVTLDEMPTSQLVSYAAVLGRALDQRNESAAEQTDEGGDVLTLEDGDEEMDISDDEEEKKADGCRAGEEVQTRKSEKSGEALAKVVTTRTYDSYTPKKDAPLHSSIDIAIQQPSSAKHGLELGEKEKRALKLAELRAKAKLARAKLRIAEQKKARGADSAKNRPPSNRTQGRSPRSSPLPPVGHPALASSTPKLRDVTALRDRGSLVISDVARTGPDAQMRFVDSVYDLSSGGDGPIRKDAPVQRARIIDLTTTPKAQSLNTNVTQPPAVQLSSDETRKKSESLKQQLHLARLQLEIKKKQLRRKELERNKKEEEALLANRRESEKAEPKQSPPPTLSNEEGHGTIQNFDNIDVIQYDDDCLSTEAHQQPSVSSCDNETETVEDAPSSHDQARLKLEQLRQRQKELKQKNDIANLRNLIHRQRDLLKAQGQELTESTAQLQSCVDGIRDKQELLDESERRLEELNHRKRIVEGMVMRATEQLIAARRALGERRQRPSP